MRPGRVFAGVFYALLAGTAAQGAPLEAYGELPSLDNLQISPDGTKLAYETGGVGQRVVVVKSFDTGTVIAALRMGDQKLRSVAWADDDHLLTTTSVTDRARGIEGPRREYFMTQSFSISEHKSILLLDNAQNSMNIVYGAPQVRTVDGHTTLFVTGVSFADNLGMPALFSVDLAANHTKLIERGSKYSLDWIVDENGNLVAKTEYDESAQHWTLKIRRDGAWQDAFSVDAAIEVPVVEGIGPDGASLLLSVPQNGVYSDRRMSLKDGSWMTPLDLGDDEVGAVSDPVTHRIIGAKEMSADISYLFFDKRDQAVWHSVGDAFLGETVTLVSWSNDRKKVVVRVDGPQDGAAYHLVDLNTNHASELGLVYHGIDIGGVAEVKQIRYPAADGTTIPAYLTLPKGRPAGNLPLIVLPHGGPMARDEPGFDWWAQALASRGYAVLQPQFRGSTGEGWNHVAAGFGEWGRKMQTDLSDGVRYLAKLGTIDDKRVCIVGASYGGYAALAGATLDPGVYRCAVSVSGISDPHGFLRWRARRDQTSDDSTMRFWTRFMGVTNDSDPKLDEISPLAHAAAVTVPILLIHGRDDTVVPIDQSEDMEDALKDAKRPVTFVKLDGEDHWLSRSDTRLQMLQATVTFLEANNPPN